MTDETAGRRISSWGELFEQMVEVGLGAAALTAEAAQKLVNGLVEQGQVAKEESAVLVDRLIAAGREQREALRQTMEQTAEAAVTRMHLARESDVAALRDRVAALEQALRTRQTAAEAPPSDKYEGEDFELDQE